MKKHVICWLDVALGVMAASVFWLVIYAIRVTPMYNTVQTESNTVTESSATSNEDVEETVIAYQTGLRYAEFSWDNGESVRYNTPENFYSLTDQYMDGLSENYGIDLPQMDRTFIVGDAANTSACTVMINAAALSDVDSILSTLYEEDYSSDEYLYSEVYTYMKNGTLSDELPDNYKLTDYGTVEVDGVTYHMYDKYYTTTYTYYDEEDVSETSPKEQTIPNYEFVAYSDTEDPVEIILYMVDYSAETAYKYMCEFVGADVPELLPEGSTIINNITESEESSNE